MTEVWVVEGISNNGQDYSDYCWNCWLVAVYPDEKTATQHCEMLNRRVKELNKEIDKITEKQKLMREELDADCNWDNDAIAYIVTKTIFALHVDDYKEKIGIQ